MSAWHKASKPKRTKPYEHLFSWPYVWACEWRLEGSWSRPRHCALCFDLAWWEANGRHDMPLETEASTAAAWRWGARCAYPLWGA